MADVSRLLDTTIAGQIARKLDENDGKKDNKIDASIWNKFISDIGTGKTVRNNISIVSAMNSITTYAVKLAAKAGKAVDDLALEWLSLAGGSSQGVQKQDEGKGSSGSGGAGKTGEESRTQAPKKPKGTKGTGEAPGKHKKSGEKYTTGDIRVTVPVKGSSSEVNAIIEAQKQGTKLHDSLKKGDLKGLTPANIAHAFTSDVNFGPNSKQIAVKVYSLMLKRMEQLGIKKDSDRKIKFDNYKELNTKLHEMRNRIVAAENEIVRSDRTKKEAYNRDRGKIQTQISKANQLLVDVANNPKQAKIERGTNEEGERCARAMLQTGEWIMVIYDKNGEIKEINISFDTTYDKTKDNKVFDGEEVCYTKEKARISTEQNGLYEYDIGGKNYNFAKLKEIAEAIFGKAQ